jgi:hypothetical protein
VEICGATAGDAAALLALKLTLDRESSFISSGATESGGGSPGRTAPAVHVTR